MGANRIGCLCATVQLAIGWYAAFKKKKISKYAREKKQLKKRSD